MTRASRRLARQCLSRQRLSRLHRRFNIPWRIQRGISEMAMLLPIRRALLLTTVVLSAFAGLETPSVMAQEPNAASDAEVFAGTSVTHATVTVVGIEAATNSVTLRGPHGNLV